MSRDQAKTPGRKVTTSEEAGHLSVVVDVDRLGRGFLGKSWHGHDVAADGDDEPRPGEETRLVDVQREPRRAAALLRIVRKRVRCLGDDDRQVAEALFLVAGQAILGFLRVGDAPGAVEPARSLFLLSTML